MFLIYNKSIIMIKAILLIALSVLALCALPPQFPIIGVYTQDAQDFGQVKAPYQTYIASSYVKNIQMAGAQVVPLFYHYSQKQLDTLLPKLNGVFFPGGEMPITFDNQWTRNIDYIIKWANKQNDKGRPFPIWGTCLGYEAVMYIFSGRQDNMTVLTAVKGQSGLTGALNIRNGRKSDLIRSLSKQQWQLVTSGKGVFWLHHSWAVTEQTYTNTKGISQFWELVSTSVTEQENITFISTLQAYNYPYYMTQYHPQKNSFEWGINASRSYNAIRVQQKFINQFIKMARLSPNRFPQDEYLKMSIDNFVPFYKPDNYFTTAYLFDESKLGEDEGSLSKQ